MCRNLHLHKQHSYWDSRAVLGGAGAAWSINGWYLVILAQFVAVLGGTGALGVGSQNASIYRRARIYTGGLVTLVTNSDQNKISRHFLAVFKYGLILLSLNSS